MSSVIELRPKRSEWADAVSLFLGGSYSGCVQATRGHEDGPARILRARALLRLERHNEALTHLSIDTTAFSTALRGEFASLASATFMALGRFDEARDCQRDARAYLYSVYEPALEIELHFLEARLAFVEGDTEGASRLAERALAVPPPSHERRTAVCTVSARADTLNLLAIVQLSRGRRRHAIELFTQAIQSISSTPHPDAGLVAKLLSNLAGNREGLDIELERSSIALVRRQHSLLTWTPELAKSQFYIVRELGWAAALDGDHLSAFRDFKCAFNLAPSPEYRLQALLDRVFLSRELEQYVLAHADLLEAQEISLSIDWTTASELEAGSLRMLAMLLAPIDLSSARAALRAYTQKQDKGLRTSTTFTDERFYAEQLQAEAAIALAEGRERAAESLTRQAFEIFDRLGIRWRAAQAALDLKASADAAHYVRYARAEAARRPQSWLASRVASA